MSTPKPMKLSDLTAHVRTEAKNLGLEDMGDEFVAGLEKRIADEVDRQVVELDKVRKGKKQQAMIRKLFGGERRLKTPEPGGHDATEFSKTLLALAHAKLDERHFERAIQWLGDQGHDTQAVERALTASDLSGGGALLDAEMSADFIGFLYNRSVVRAMGANIVQMPRSGKLDFPAGNLTATAYWEGENVETTPSEQSFQKRSLDGKKLSILVPISNDLLRQAPPGFESIIRDDLVNTAVVKEDTGFIRGDGSGGSPVGIRNQLDASQINAISGAADLATVTSDLLRIQYLVRKSNIPMERLGWMLHPRTKYFLMSLRTDDGYHVFREELVADMLYGSPVGTTQNIPSTLNTDETEIYFGSFAQVVVGDTLTTEVAMSDSASFVQNSTQQNAFARDLTVLRLIHVSDILLRYSTAFSVLTAVDWGAGLD